MRQLSEQAALNWVGANEWRKGRSYVQRLTGLSAQPDGQSWTVRASAHGQEKYAVQATLQEDAVKKAHCSCPVGEDGHCKHVAALLARYSAHPEDFAELPDLGALLGEMDADDLRQLVRALLDRAPELQRLVLTARRSEGKGGQGRGSRKKAGFHDLHRRIDTAFSLLDYDPENDWEGEGPDLSDFGPLLNELSEGLDQLGDLDVDAQGQLLVACLALLSGSQDVQDDDYGVEPTELFTPARTGLLKLLQQPLNTNLREMALEGLQDAIAELGWPRHELDGEHQTELFAALPAEERRLIRDFVQQLLGRTRVAYRRQGLTELLYVLTAGEQLGLEEELRLARATEDPVNVLAALLKHGQTEQATQELRRSGKKVAPQELEALFTQHGLLPQLEDYARQNLKVFGARAWLYARLRDTGRLAEAHALARDAVLSGTGDHPFFVARFMGEYVRDPDWLAELKRVSPDWPADRAEYIKKLRKDRGQSDMLLRFLLDEDLLDDAQKLAQERQNLTPELLGRLALRLPATAAEPLVLRAVLLHVAGRGRDHYRTAAELLTQAGPLLGQEETRAMAQLLLRDFPTLRALKDELQQARLL